MLQEEIKQNHIICSQKPQKAEKTEKETEWMQQIENIYKHGRY